MRSTATLEPDVSSRFQRMLASRKQTRKSLMNEVMRRGMDALESAEPAPKPFVLVPFESGEILDHRLPSHINAELEMQELIEKMRRSSSS